MTPCSLALYASGDVHSPLVHVSVLSAVAEEEEPTALLALLLARKARDDAAAGPWMNLRRVPLPAARPALLGGVCHSQKLTSTLLKSQSVVSGASNSSYSSTAVLRGAGCACAVTCGAAEGKDDAEKLAGAAGHVDCLTAGHEVMWTAIVVWFLNKFSIYYLLLHRLTYILDNMWARSFFPRADSNFFCSAKGIL